jgi:hypothetical protein
MMTSEACAVMIAETDASHITNHGWKVQRERLDHLTVRFVRGNKMRTVDALFNETAAAFQFPYYFGENWAAFSECLSDPSWLDSEHFVMIAMQAEQILADEPLDLPAFGRALGRTIQKGIRRFSSPTIVTGKAKPFQVILHCPPGRNERLRPLLDILGMQARRLAIESNTRAGAGE